MVYIILFLYRIIVDHMLEAMRLHAKIFPKSFTLTFLSGKTFKFPVRLFDS